MKTVPLPWSARSSHLAGIPRRVVFTTVGTLSKLVTSFLNNTHVHNLDTLLQLVRDRPPGTALLTVSNHACTIDDPLMWGIKGFPMDPKLARWTLTAKDICFTNPVFSYFFRLGKCIPITRGAGIYQPHMNEALERLNDGDWLHTFPEGKISQENGPIGRLKWGTASLIARATVPPIVLPVCHSGFEKVMPEKYWLGRRPLLPLCSKNISIVVGEPMQFDISSLRQTAEEKTGEPSNFPEMIAGVTKEHQREERILQWLYSHLSDQLRTAMQDIYCKAKSLHRKMET